MKVFVPKTSNVAKILGLSLVSLVFSLSLSAFDQNQAEQGKDRKVSKGADQTQAQTKDCGQGQSQSQTQTKDCGQGQSQSQAQIKDCGQGQSQAQSDNSQVSKGKPSDCGTQAPAPAPTRGCRFTQAQCTQHTVDQFVGQHSTSKQISSWKVCGKHGNKMTKIKGANWSALNWNGLHVSGVRLDDIDSTGAVMTDAHVSGEFRDWALNDSTIKYTTFSGRFRNVDFKNALIEDTIFEEAFFVKRHGGHNSNFDKATLRRVTFHGGQLNGMTFRGTHLDDVDFPCANIKDPGMFDGAYVLHNGEWLELKDKSYSYFSNWWATSCKGTGYVNSRDWLRGYNKH